MEYSKTVWKNRNVQFPNRFAMTTNSDGTVNLTQSSGAVIEEGTPVNADNLNNIENGIATAIDATMFKRAGGTANAITVLLNSELTDGFPVNFIVGAANGGTATTLNGIPIYRVGGTTTPSFTVGQLVTVIYSESNLCFFYKASAEGNATPAQVMINKIFSTFNQTGLVGTMPNNGNITKNITTSGGTVVVPAGYVSGGTITAPTIAQLTTDANINNSNQIQSGFSAYGASGTLYNGSFVPYGVLATTGVSTVNTSTNVADVVINGVPAMPKLIFFWFNCTAYIASQSYTLNRQITGFYDPNRLIMPLFGNGNAYVHLIDKINEHPTWSQHFAEAATYSRISYSNGTFSMNSSLGTQMGNQNVPVLIFY